MKSPRPRLPLQHVGRVVILLAMLLGSAVALAGPAAAHADFVESDPSEGAVLDRPPELFTVTFSEEMDPALSFVSLSVDAGTAIPMEVRSGSNPTELVATPDPASDVTDASKYLVRYRVTSVDGHPVSGEVSFRVTQTALEASAPGDGTPSTAASNAPEEGSDRADRDAEEAPSDIEEPPGLTGLLVPGLVILLILILALIVALGRVFRPAEADTEPGVQPSEFTGSEPDNRPDR